LQTDRASRLSPLAARRLKRKPLARFPGNCQATAGVYIFVNTLYRFTTALGLVFAAVVSSLAQDEVVEFDPREVGGLLSPLELTGLVVAGFVWLLYWQLLKRAILIRAFCVWFPTAMLGIVALLMWLSNVTSSSSFPGSVLEVLAFFAIGINIPGLFPVWLLGSIFLNYLPVGARPLIAGGLFWFSWYFILRFLRWRTTLEERIVLKLSE